MLSEKRIGLGFEDQSDGSGEEEVFSPRKVQKRTKLPKFTFKTDKIGDDDIDDDINKVRPNLGHETNGDHSDTDDYMNIQIQEDETSKPQSLRSKEETRTKPQYEFENFGKKDDEPINQKVSLFGQIQEESNDDDDSHFDVDVIRPVSRFTKSSSKGLSIMEKMGFKIGDTLGLGDKNKDALLEPLQLAQRKGRTGIKESLDPKLEAKIPKNGLTEEQADQYRKRLIDEDTEHLKERLLHKMQKLCWQLTGGADIPDIGKLDPLGVNVLWRGYVQFLQQVQRQSRERSQENGDGDEPAEENTDDDELLMFQELSLDAQIEKLYMFLRAEFDYCFYCGTRYLNQRDLYSHCPGLTPEDHQ